MTPDQIELCMIREFSVGGLQIAKSPNRVDRRERIRQAIYLGGKMSHPFYDTPMTYAEAFKACFGERLDRRAALRDLSDDDDDDDDDDDMFAEVGE